MVLQGCAIIFRTIPEAQLSHRATPECFFVRLHILLDVHASMVFRYLTLQPSAIFVSGLYICKNYVDFYG
jgi:hypothetical protein